MTRLAIGTKVRVRHLLDELLPFKGCVGEVVLDDGSADRDCGNEEADPERSNDCWPYTVRFEDGRNGNYCSSELEVLP